MYCLELRKTDYRELKNVVKEDQELSSFTKTTHMNNYFKVVFIRALNKYLNFFVLKHLGYSHSRLLCCVRFSRYYTEYNKAAQHHKHIGH